MPTIRGGGGSSTGATGPAGGDLSGFYPNPTVANRTGLVPVNKTAPYTAFARDWVLCDTTGGTFAVTTPGSPTDTMMFAVTWTKGGIAPTISGTVLGSPAFGGIGNTIWLQYSTTISPNQWIVL